MKLLTNLVRMLLLSFFIEYLTSNQFMSVFLQRCHSYCNKKYCNATVRCRPLNRTSKWMSMDLYILPGLKLEAPINIEVIGYKKFRTQYRQHMLKLKAEFCAQLNNTNHPFFSIFFIKEFDGNMLDPCPISGHRYEKPWIPAYDHYPLVPVGEWRVDFIFSKTINNSEEFIFSWSEFYEVKPTSAIEF